MNAKNIAACILLLSICSCGTDDAGLSPEAKYTVDTIYSQQLNEWRNHVDELCKAQKDSLFLHFVDSLKKERMEEIEMYLMKNHNEE